MGKREDTLIRLKEHAEEFATAARLLHDAKDTFIGTGPPRQEPSFKAAWIVTMSFAIELYLKLLIRIDGRTPNETHNLHDLFNDLDVAHRRLIDECVRGSHRQRKGKWIRETRTASEILKQDNLVYRNWRYTVLEGQKLRQANIQFVLSAAQFAAHYSLSGELNNRPKPRFR